MRVLVDSSVWIDHLRGARTRETAMFDALLALLDPEPEPDDRAASPALVVGDLVLCEVLRGIPDPREHAAVRDVMLSFEVVAIGGVDLALEGGGSLSRFAKAWGDGAQDHRSPDRHPLHRRGLRSAAQRSRFRSDDTSSGVARSLNRT